MSLVATTYLPTPSPTRTVNGRHWSAGLVVVVRDYDNVDDYVYDDYDGDNHSVKFDDVHIIGESTFLTCGLRGGVCSRGSHRLDISTQWEPW